MLAKTVPAGDDWQHEIKFDGFRVQAHIIGKTIELFSRNGYKFGRRYPPLTNLGQYCGSQMQHRTESYVLSMRRCNFADKPITSTEVDQ